MQVKKLTAKTKVFGFDLRYEKMVEVQYDDERVAAVQNWRAGFAIVKA